MRMSWIQRLIITMCFAVPALAKAPPGRFVLDAKGETVYDSLTKRTWQRTVDAGSYTSANAKTYCASLSLAGGGWHLPDIREMRSIVDRNQHKPAIDPHAFPNTPSDWFCTATPTPWSASAVWGIYFGDGSSLDVSGGLRVRCVR